MKAKLLLETNTASARFVSCADFASPVWKSNQAAEIEIKIKIGRLAE